MLCKEIIKFSITPAAALHYFEKEKYQDTYKACQEANCYIPHR